MPREKSSGQMLSADGAGGMRVVVDNRFEGGAWPIDFVVKKRDATPWMAHLHAECEARSWHPSRS